MKILALGIETSCDDTSISLIEGECEGNICQNVRIVILRSFSQDTILKQFGGVVPEIAARNHLQKFIPLLRSVLEESKVEVKQLHHIAVTTRPGLLGPLLTGLSFAKSLSLFLKIPINPIDHLKAHLEAIHLTQNVSYPYLGLLVSGGHSQYHLVRGPQDFTLLGGTIDDAAGEAFDKGGRLMGLSYPAGQLIDMYAAKGDSERFQFPIGLKDSKNTQLSFSGLKTSLKLLLEQQPHLAFNKDSQEQDQVFYDLCASYQMAICKALLLKLTFALSEVKKMGIQKAHSIPIVLGGGVACNSGLRRSLTKHFGEERVLLVRPQYCTDNGAMIANYSLRTMENLVSFPECLMLDASSRASDL